MAVLKVDTFFVILKFEPLGLHYSIYMSSILVAYAVIDYCETFLETCLFRYFPELFHAYYNVLKENKCETCPGSSNAFSSIIPKEEPNDYCPG